MKKQLVLMLCATVFMISYALAVAPTVGLPTLTNSHTSDRNYFNFPIDINAVATGADLNADSACWLFISTGGNPIEATWISDFNTCSITGLSSASEGDFNFSMVVQNSVGDANGTSPTAFYWRDNQSPTTTLICGETSAFVCDDSPLDSGCYLTQFSVNGGEWQDYSGAFSLQLNRTYTIDFNSIDNLGNMETTNSEECNLVTSVDVNLSPFSRLINNSSGIVENVTQGVSDQGALIGLAIGLTIAITFIAGLIIFITAMLTGTISRVKKVR